MKKNVASQVIGAQMVSATDGSAFTGSVTVAVLGDGGTQATGSVGSGACTHEGNGFHTYVPAQAETNYDHIAFTFIGTGAVPATVQLYTEFPQTGDAFADTTNIKTRLPAALTANGNMKASVLEIIATALTETSGQIAAGFKKLFDVASPVFTLLSVVQTGDSYGRLGAPAGASVSADVAAVKVDTAAVKVQTDKLTFTVANQVDSNVLDWKSATAPAMTGDAFARLGAPAGASVSADVAAVKAVLPAALVSGRIDASVGAMAANVLTATAIATDAITAAKIAADAIGASELAADAVTEIQTGLATAASIAALNNLSAAQVNAEVLDVINVDTYAEPGQGAPAATTSLAAKINYLYKAWRNKKTQTATLFNLFADDASTVDQKATVSDDGTTYTSGEIASGP